ncbi:immunity 42 family protein [Pseudomonas edaphica]|uniref:immunity 42 family protein n=1 Tax=Pseudomonas edaphica TaxID=2006980 RepID=UPI003D14A1C6
MIFGDPHNFAILIQCFPEWGDSTSKNGMFHFCIDGFFLPEEIKTSTLWVDVYSLLDNSNPLYVFQDDKNIFEKDAKSAFIHLLGMISPELIGEDESEEFEQSYRFQASTENINDSGYAVFAVSDNDLVRVLGARHSELQQDGVGGCHWERVGNFDVKEAYIEKDKIIDMLAGVRNYYSSI